MTYSLSPSCVAVKIYEGFRENFGIIISSLYLSPLVSLLSTCCKYDIINSWKRGFPEMGIPLLQTPSLH